MCLSLRYSFVLNHEQTGSTATPCHVLLERHLNVCTLYLICEPCEAVRHTRTASPCRTLLTDTCSFADPPLRHMACASAISVLLIHATSCGMESSGPCRCWLARHLEVLADSTSVFAEQSEPCTSPCGLFLITSVCVCVCVVQPGILYPVQLVQLNGMGFTNEAKNIDVLKKTGGNVDTAVAMLVGVSVSVLFAEPCEFARGLELRTHAVPCWRHMYTWKYSTQHQSLCLAISEPRASRCCLCDLFSTVFMRTAHFVFVSILQTHHQKRSQMKSLSILRLKKMMLKTTVKSVCEKQRLQMNSNSVFDVWCCVLTFEQMNSNLLCLLRSVGVCHQGNTVANGRGSCSIYFALRCVFVCCVLCVVCCVCVTSMSTSRRVSCVVCVSLSVQIWYESSVNWSSNSSNSSNSSLFESLLIEKTKESLFREEKQLYFKLQSQLSEDVEERRKWDFITTTDKLDLQIINRQDQIQHFHMDFYSFGLSCLSVFSLVVTLGHGSLL